MSRHETRAALLDYAREWAAGTADRKQGEIQALLAACRPSWSPMLRWSTFGRLSSSVATGDAGAQRRYLAALVGGGS